MYCLQPQLFPDIVTVFGTEVKPKPKPGGEGGDAGAPEKKKVEVRAAVEAVQSCAYLFFGNVVPYCP